MFQICLCSTVHILFQFSSSQLASQCQPPSPLPYTTPQTPMILLPTRKGPLLCNNNNNINLIQQMRFVIGFASWQQAWHSLADHRWDLCPASDLQGPKFHTVRSTWVAPHSRTSALHTLCTAWSLHPPCGSYGLQSVAEGTPGLGWIPWYLHGHCLWKGRVHLAVHTSACPGGSWMLQGDSAPQK